MTSDLSDQLARTNELLGILVKVQLRDVISVELADAKKRKLYDLTGGALSVKQLSQQLGMSTGTISQTWQKWDEVGLLVKHGSKYRRTLE